MTGGRPLGDCLAANFPAVLAWCVSVPGGGSFGVCAWVVCGLEKWFAEKKKIKKIFTLIIIQFFGKMDLISKIVLMKVKKYLLF